MRAAPRIAVIGGGAAGLAAAQRLQQAGAAVVVYEARPWLGGRVRTDEVDGYRIDTCAQLFGSMYRCFFRLLDELGAGDLAVRTPMRDALWRNGRAHEVVYGSLASMLASGALPARTKLRLGTRYLPFLARHAAYLEMHALERAAAAGLDAESIAEWGEREIGRDFVEYLVYPLLAASVGALPEQTSAALYHLLASAGTDVTMYALRGGAGTFAQAAVKSIRRRSGEIRLATPARRVQPHAERVVVSAEGGDDAFDGVVVATPAPAVPDLVDGLTESARAWFAGVRYQPTLSLALLLDRPVGARYFGLALPREAASTVATLCIAENKAPGLVPQGRGLLVVYPAPAAVPRLLDREPRAVLAAVLPEVTRVFPGVDRSIQRVKLYRWPEGGPVFYPGYLRHLQRFRDGEVEGQGKTVYAGDYLHAPSVEGAVVAGIRAAERLLARLGTAG